MSLPRQILHAKAGSKNEEKTRRMRIGLIDVDGHNYPNFALMKLSGYHKKHGDHVEWANPLMGSYDRVYQSKIFTFSQDKSDAWDCEVIRGGTGYSISSCLPDEIENNKAMDYSLYSQYEFSLEFLSRGCIRSCPFCLVKEKEGDIHPVEPVELNPKGKWIELLDNNFFASPLWKDSIQWLLQQNQPINFHGVDIRIMNEEQAYWLNKIPIHRSYIHIAWDIPTMDLTEKLKEVLKYLKPWKLMCYVLIGFNSTLEQDLYRIERLRELGIKPYVMPYRDFENKRKPTQYEKDLAQYVNKPMIFASCRFEDFQPRKGFKCKEYLKHERI